MDGDPDTLTSAKSRDIPLLPVFAAASGVKEMRVHLDERLASRERLASG
jgi:hypothetical protein